jgi:hypothetical protein
MSESHGDGVEGDNEGQNTESGWIAGVEMTRDEGDEVRVRSGDKIEGRWRRRTCSETVSFTMSSP